MSAAEGEEAIKELVLVRCEKNVFGNVPSTEKGDALRIRARHMIEERMGQLRDECTSKR